MINAPVTITEVFIESTVSISESSVIVQSNITENPVAINTTFQEGVKGNKGDLGPSGMSDLIYDPNGVRDNVFNAANLAGNIDGGTFT